MSFPFSIVVATDESGSGIGYGGTLPWKCSHDMVFFRKLTSQCPESQINAVIMGRKTYESIPKKFRPLPGRLNIVLSKNVDYDLGEVPQGACAVVATSLDLALSLCAPKHASDTTTPGLGCPPVNQAFVIGGGNVYREALTHPCLNYIFSSRIKPPTGESFVCDTYFATDVLSAVPTTIVNEHPAFKMFDLCAPAADATTTTAEHEPTATLTVRVASRATDNDAERQYLDLVRRVIDSGIVRGDRTGVGTRSLFGTMTRWSMRGGRIPVLTTKRVFWKGVMEELLWFIKGDTDGARLAAKGVRIWDGNGSREFLDKLGFTSRREGDLGPIYGFQWRHFGATYRGPDDSYEGQGVDQLKEIITTLKRDPNSRRLLMSAWNPTAIPEMALPPCHVMAQFYVADGELSCMLTQRSCDLGLGVPFNIASYALLTILIAQVTGLRPGDMVHSMGDTHVYSNHIEPLREQLQRAPRPFPFVAIDPTIKLCLFTQQDIDDFRAEHIQLIGYNPAPIIKMEMAV